MAVGLQEQPRSFAQEAFDILIGPEVFLGHVLVGHSNAEDLLEEEHDLDLSRLVCTRIGSDSSELSDLLMHLFWAHGTPPC